MLKKSYFCNGKIKGFYEKDIFCFNYLIDGYNIIIV